MTGSPLQAPVLALSELGPVRRFVTTSRPGRRVALRFVAGERLEDGLAAARSLNTRGIGGMLDHLGENVTSVEHAASAADHYALALKRIDEAGDLDCNIAVKLTQLGLDLGFDLCLENLERVLAVAADRGTQVMVDMESHPYVDRTLEVVRRLRDRYPNLGVALQSSLYRTAGDVFGLPERTPVRLVKGAYLEPPEVAYRSRRDVDRSYARVFATLLTRGHEIHLGTHDPRLLEGASRLVARHHAWDRVEIQMLYGIRQDLQNGYASRGRPVRTYIPYGDQWYPYLTRRLAERPANMWFFATNALRGSR